MLSGITYGIPRTFTRRAPRDDLNDSSCQGTVLDFSIFQPYEVALVGEPGEADTQTLIDTACAAHLPNKVVAGCAPDDEEDAGLIPLLADRPTLDGRTTAYVCEGYAYQNPTTDPEGLARLLGIS
jgi:uncharacterized protein YyaL (SSP411 family)